MIESRVVFWRRLGLEFLVIVVGVLIALAVDDWRQSRADRALEKHLLTSLLEDLEADEVDSKNQESLVQMQLDAVDNILAVIDHPLAPSAAPKSAAGSDINSWLRMLSWKAELEIAEGTYSEMIATGAFLAIRNAELRKQISSYYYDSRHEIMIFERQIDPRSDFLTALASVGIVPGYADHLPDLVARLKSEPLIATHALRIRQYYAPTWYVTEVREKRQSLVSSIQREIERLP